MSYWPEARPCPDTDGTPICAWCKQAGRYLHWEVVWYDVLLCCRCLPGHVPHSPPRSRGADVE